MFGQPPTVPGRLAAINYMRHPWPPLAATPGSVPGLRRRSTRGMFPTETMHWMSGSDLVHTSSNDPTRAGPAGPAEAIDGRRLSIEGTVVRLADIDTPDLDQDCAMEGLNYPCGRPARAALAYLLTGAQTECRIVGRPVGAPPLAECLADGFDLSLNMVHTGWAFADTAQSNRYAHL